jgi:hypothetical protein
MEECWCCCISRTPEVQLMSSIQHTALSRFGIICRIRNALHHVYSSSCSPFIYNFLDYASLLWQRISGQNNNATSQGNCDRGICLLLPLDNSHFSRSGVVARESRFLISVTAPNVQGPVPILLHQRSSVMVICFPHIDHTMESVKPHTALPYRPSKDLDFNLRETTCVYLSHRQCTYKADRFMMFAILRNPRCRRPRTVITRRDSRTLPWRRGTTRISTDLRATGIGSYSISPSKVHIKSKYSGGEARTR